MLPQLLAANSPSLVTNYLLKYTTHAAEFATLTEAVVSHGLPLLTQVILPLIQRVPADEEIWRENPVEFIHRESDMTKSYYSPKSSAVDLLVALCKTSYFPSVIQYISDQLASNPPLQYKEALLTAVGSLFHIIKEHNQYSAEMQNLLQNYVMPEFENSVGFMRLRACWMYSRFASFPFNSAEHQELALSKICALTNDAELPVKVEAATALPKLLIWAVSMQKVKPDIKSLLGVYLNIMNSVDSENLVDALEVIISRFAEDIIPFALEMTEHLKDAFFRMAKQEDSSHDEESAMAAVATLNSISKIVDALEDLPEDLFRISLVIQPIFDFTLSFEGCEFFEEAVHMLTCMLYYAPENSLVHLFDLVKHIKLAIVGSDKVKPYAGEHIDEVFSAVGNFIGKYKALAVENMHIFSEFIFELLGSERNEILLGCKIAICLLEQLPGQCDTLYPGLIAKATELLFMLVSKAAKIACAELVCVSL